MDGNLFLSPREVLERVSQALPATVRERVIVVGSLAAGFHFFGDQGGMAVRTKDADCLLSPRLAALAAGTALADKLFDAKWTYHPVDEFPEAGTSETREDRLPVLRLDPPEGPGWFLEVLGAHGANDQRERSFDRIATAQGHFALASFRYLALCERNPLETDVGVRIARPEAMALANLLAQRPATAEELLAVGRRLVQDAIEALEALARGGDDPS